MRQEQERFVRMDVSWCPDLMQWGHTRVCPRCEGGGILSKILDVSDDPLLSQFLGDGEVMAVRACDHCKGRGRVLWACNN